ncbi:TIGR03067 domain-containing protein [Stieleria sp. JC731]|uniref:TIGR03067 domain-containing protein n=1 Tax=Pirellulaceae TaxID=2691357 RepID=UPI001E3E6B48|nr:TIGR03067 domain-containing protein [Stieleria sp. JC731]MCC9598950.1 TIGR03067 domain-containing protein [Stieleria sp. JC731]
MRFASLFVAALAALPAVADEPVNAPNDTTIEKLQGRWEILEGWNQGRILDESAVDGSFVMIKTNQITTFDTDQKQTYQAMFRIDESATPVRITMTALSPDIEAIENNSLKEPTNTPPVAAGILKFTSDNKLTLCYALPGGEAPTKFESPKGSKTMMFVMERRKPNKDLVKSISPIE